MQHKILALILTAAAALSLCGCSGLYDKEYLSVNDYEPTV